MAEISTLKSRLDVGMIHRYLSIESYWAKGIPRDLVETAIANSLCFGAYDDGGEQVGFARVITDYATFGYLSDVFVIASHRGRGIGKELMQAIRAHPALRPLRRWHLLTNDAHALYAHVGFVPLSDARRHMEISVKNPYLTPAATGG